MISPPHIPPEMVHSVRVMAQMNFRLLPQLHHTCNVVVLITPILLHLCYSNANIKEVLPVCYRSSDLVSVTAIIRVTAAIV